MIDDLGICSPFNSILGRFSSAEMGEMILGSNIAQAYEESQHRGLELATYGNEPSY